MGHTANRLASIREAARCEAAVSVSQLYGSLDTESAGGARPLETYRSPLWALSLNAFGALLAVVILLVSARRHPVPRRR